LEEWIKEQGLSQQRVADLMGCSRKQVNEIVHGRAPVSSDTAIRLERVVGIPADSWLRYEAAYRADLARISDQENLAAHADEIDPNAISYLPSDTRSHKATRRTPGALVSDFLAFHRCGARDVYIHLHETAATGDYALAALKDAAGEIGASVRGFSTGPIRGLGHSASSHDLSHLDYALGHFMKVITYPHRGASHRDANLHRRLSQDDRAGNTNELRVDSAVVNCEPVASYFLKFSSSMFCFRRG
jgi:addiction module HigA family antidote